MARFVKVFPACVVLPSRRLINDAVGTTQCSTVCDVKGRKGESIPPF